MTEPPFPPIEPVRGPDDGTRLQAALSRINHLRRRRRSLGVAGATVIALALSIPFILSGGPSRSRSVQVIGRSTTTAPASSTTVPASSTTSPSPTTTLAKQSPSTSIVSGASGWSCTGRSGPGGTLTVCPSSAPVGATVAIYTNSRCGTPANSRLGSLVFLGPKAYIGSGGGGDQIPNGSDGTWFSATFRVPASYLSGEPSGNRQTPVTPGSGYSFATYPAGACEVPFTVLPYTPEPQGTAQVVYQPFTAQGTIDPRLKVTKVVSGGCNAGSGVAGYSSYRCGAQTSVGYEILDPCFARPGATTGPLVCPSNPAGDDVTELNTATIPPAAASQGGPEQGPWAVQLANGQICIWVNAAWSGLGPLGCQLKQPPAPADCHPPQASTPWWTAFCQNQFTDSSPFVPYRIVTVWL